jgi:3-oxoacyl-[acyl-carrier protein] reductase
MNFCDLTGKIALVTGATGGIGEAICESLKNAGAELIVTGTNQEKVDALVNKLGAKNGIACNLTDSEDRKKLIGEAGQIDILVNNAGMTGDCLFPRQKRENWDNVMELNLNAAMDLSQLVLRGMMKNRWGRIINMSSVIASTGNAGQTAYSASKAGLEAFGKSLAKEIGRRNITVNAIAPGFIATNMTAELPEDTMAEYKSKIALTRFGEPQEIADVVRFLASNEGGYITGTTVHVNGGMY